MLEPERSARRPRSFFLRLRLAVGRTHSPEESTKFAVAVGSGLSDAAAALGDSLRFEVCEFDSGEPTTFADVSCNGFDGPGLVVVLDAGEDRMAILIPSTLPLPDWVTAPDKSEEARLQNLAFEWSVLLLPPELEATATGTRYVEDLWSIVEEGEPDGSAAVLDLTVDLGQTTAGAAVRLVWPLVATPQDETPEPGETPEPVESASPEPPPTAPVGAPTANAPAPATTAGAATSDVVALAKRLGTIRVPISVRLAEKQIDVKQLIDLTPGVLVMFEKSCESPLDLFVNNRRFAIGEAVKIGEKFGLKIDEYVSDEPE